MLLSGFRGLHAEVMETEEGTAVEGVHRGVGGGGPGMGPRQPVEGGGGRP